MSDLKTQSDRDMDAVRASAQTYVDAEHTYHMNPSPETNKARISAYDAHQHTVADRITSLQGAGETRGDAGRNAVNASHKAMKDKGLKD